MSFDQETLIGYTSLELVNLLCPNPRFSRLWRPVKRTGFSGSDFLNNLGLGFLEGFVKSDKTRCELLELCVDKLMDEVVRSRFQDAQIPSGSVLRQVLATLRILPTSLADLSMLKLLSH
eukprot:409967_1